MHPIHLIVQERRAIIHLFKSISSFVYSFTQEIRVGLHDINGEREILGRSLVALSQYYKLL